jgi:oligopeptide/dipeptide ABC transporter ATP-binding protein
MSMANASVPSAQPMQSVQRVQPVLHVEGLAKQFLLETSYVQHLLDWTRGKPPATLQALDQVSFDVFPEETVGILGESGSGKSTLARVLMGLCAADSGAALLQGKSLLNPHSAERFENLRRMQMVFQDPFASLDPRMTVEQILTEPLIIHGISSTPPWSARLLKALDEVGLEPEALGRYPNEFSGGQRQRIGICRALILDPVLLIADEAVSALDVSVQAHILDLFVQLKKRRQLSLLFISHDVAVVKQLSDRILVLFRGRIVESMPAACLLEDPIHPYTRRLTSAALELREGRKDPHPEFGTDYAAQGCLFQNYCAQSDDQCRTAPELMEIHPGHRVACWKKISGPLNQA